MKILIGLVLLALIYFIYKKVTGGNASADVAPSDDHTASATHNTASPSTDSEQTDAISAAAGATAAATATASMHGASTDSGSASAVQKALTSDLPLEHLVGIDRRAGKALKALGIADMNALVNTRVETLNAAGFDGAAAKALQAQAALSALPGLTPHEASVLANSGIDSIAALASQESDALLAKVAQANKSSGALKTAPGVQQLQRLINSAKSAA